MPRETFQQELDELVDRVIGLGSEVEGSLENMVRAMEGRDASLAEKELGVDIRYKARGAEIERDGMILQARQAPVARDLRLLYTVQSVANHLVRSGTLTEHICPGPRATSSARASTSSRTATSTAPATCRPKTTRWTSSTPRR
jgi:phosphate transport system protein